jgi:transcriptional regulator
MYVPKHFAIEERGALVRFIEAEPFGTLVSHVHGALFASHVPFVVHSRGERTTLGLHIARANPQWEQIDGQEVLAIFRGPHAMISASWYADPERNVPTWNYAAVHCAGRARVTDEAGTRRILQQLVSRLERHWRIEQAAPEYMARMEQHIVGIEIDVTRLDGKIKHSQNRSPQDRRRVVESLSASERCGDRDLAAHMRTTLGLPQNANAEEDQNSTSVPRRSSHARS